MKQALVEQGVSREQENSYLEWPDRTNISRDFEFFCYLPI